MDTASARYSSRIILDTNLFVAAGFNPGSHSAAVIERVRAGELTLVWNQATQAETRHILERIPPLHWERFAALFQPAGRFDSPNDRKFAPLAAASGARLISNDEHLLGVGKRARPGRQPHTSATNT